MIGHAPKREQAAVKPSPESEAKRRKEGQDRSFPASNVHRPPEPEHNRPLWDQYPETD
jgi:hypothetical protein